MQVQELVQELVLVQVQELVLVLVLELVLVLALVQELVPQRTQDQCKHFITTCTNQQSSCHRSKKGKQICG